MPKIPRGGCRSQSLGEPSPEKPFGLLVSTGLGARSRRQLPGRAGPACGPLCLRGLKPHPLLTCHAAACLFLSLLPTACFSWPVAPRGPVWPPLRGQVCPCRRPHPPHPPWGHRRQLDTCSLLPGPLPWPSVYLARPGLSMVHTVPSVKTSPPVSPRETNRIWTRRVRLALGRLSA